MIRMWYNIYAYINLPVSVETVFLARQGWLTFVLGRHDLPYEQCHDEEMRFDLVLFNWKIVPL